MTMRCPVVQKLCCNSQHSGVSFPALLHLVFRLLGNWKCHGWYIRPVSRLVGFVAPPPPRQGTPDKTSHCQRGCDHINKNKYAHCQGESWTKAFCQLLLCAELQMLSQMFIKDICVLSLIFYHSALL